MVTRERLADIDPDLLCADGFDDCIIGVAYLNGGADVVAYDLNKVILSLIRDGMSEGEALEYFDYNIQGAYMGERTPIFIETFD